MSNSNPSISFIIITNGKNTDKLWAQLESVYCIDNSEIIICGDLAENTSFVIDSFDLIYIPDEVSAQIGNLGKMRNQACEAAKGKYLVISDDDMLFPSDWGVNFSKYLEENPPFDILVTKILCPDGTRFWDKCCYQSPTHGHLILNPNEEDDFLYMSGGQSWIMDRRVWESSKWNENYLIYRAKGLADYYKGEHNEDTEFALTVRNLGFKIDYTQEISVTHNDNSYTSFGRMVRRRARKSIWIPDDLNIGENQVAALIQGFHNAGMQAEMLDVYRIYKKKFPNLLQLEKKLERVFGKNDLVGSEFKYKN